jgi:lysophospholipase L1-like esterase
MNKSYWRDAVLTGATLVVLLVLQFGATSIFKMRHGRFPAEMIELAASRAIMFKPGMNGYYEHIFQQRVREEDVRRAKWQGPDRVFDPYLIYRLKPNLKNIGEWPSSEDVPSNSFGYEGPEWSIQKPPNTRRIALLGDSVTEGWGVNPDQTFGALLERRLNATQPGGPSESFQVMRFAVGGYRLTETLGVAEQDVPQFDPDVYVVALTELSVSRSWDAHLVDLAALGLDPKYDYLRETLREAKVSTTDDDSTLYAKLDPFRMAVLRETLSELKANAQQHHAQFIVLLVPTLEDAGLRTNRFAGIPELLASLDITTVNLLDTFDDVPNVVPLRVAREDPHPNAKGHAMIAASLYARIHAQPKAWTALVGPSPNETEQAATSKSNSF